MDIYLYLVSCALLVRSFYDEPIPHPEVFTECSMSKWTWLEKQRLEEAYIYKENGTNMVFCFEIFEHDRDRCLYIHYCY
jgi:hypothetical protein